MSEATRPLIPYIPRPAGQPRIAIFRGLFLGDMVLAAPALRALRARFPQAEITFIGLPWAREFVARFPAYIDRFVEFVGYPNINEVPVIPERTAQFLAEQRAYGYDLAIQMHGSGGVSNGFVADLGAKVSIGLRESETPDPRLTWSLPYDWDAHEAERWLKLVEGCKLQVEGLNAQPSTFNLQPSTLDLEFPTTAAEERRARALLARASHLSGPLVGLHVGAKDEARRWPASCFYRLGDALVDQVRARIVLTGSAGERALTAWVQRQMHGPALDLAGATDLGTFAALIGQLDLLITNDTGAAHLAAAMGTPSITLYGQTRPDNWAAPDRERHRVIDAPAVVPDAADGAEALARLPVTVVLDEALDALDTRERVIA